MKKVVLVFVAIVCLLFIASCVTKEVAVTQTYYETEYRQEAYTTNKEYSIFTPHTITIYDGKSLSGHNYVAIIFNQSKDGQIYLATIEYGDWHPQIKKFTPETKGINQRISITEPICFIGLSRVRDTLATSEGFQPTYEVTMYRDEGFTPSAELLGQVLKSYGFKDYETTTYVKGLKDLETWIPAGLPEELFHLQKTMAQWGFEGDIESDNVVEELFGYVIGYVKGTKLKDEDTKRPYELPLDVMFEKGDWCLVVLSFESYEISSQGQVQWVVKPIHLNYVWDSVETGVKETTEYREIPIQVEKERTVTELKRVPFWEAGSK